MLNTKEHQDLMAAFERERSGRMDKEPRESWSRGTIYQDGRMNDLFLDFRRGYAYGLCAASLGSFDLPREPIRQGESK